MASQIPPHLQPVVEAGDGPVASLGEGLRCAVREVVVEAFINRAAVNTADAKIRAQAYARAVAAYVTNTSPRFPVDPRRVATNRHLWPGEARLERGEDTLTLTDPDGNVYANPISVARDTVHPNVITAIAVRTQTSKAAAFIPIDLGVKVFATTFQWPRGEFPIAAARVDSGAVIVWHPDGTWTMFGEDIDSVNNEVNNSVNNAPAGLVVTSSSPLSSETMLIPPAEQTSALKGARGESRVYEILARRAGFKLRDVSHRARSADMVVEAPGCRVFVDAKDYAVAVPDKEVQKFRRDLGARGAEAGVLVSLSSGIVGVKGTLTAALEVLPLEGRVAPIVYVASGHEDVIAAGVDLAAHLARVHPGTLAATALHPRDALEAYVAGLEEVSDLFEDARAEAGRLAAATAGGFGGVLEKLGAALRDQRRLVRAQRAAVETIEEVSVNTAGGVNNGVVGTAWAFFAERYAVPDEIAGIVREILAALGEGPCQSSLGDIRPESRWRFLKAKAVHIATGAMFTFLKTRTDFGRPLARLSAERTGALLARHPKKVRVADEALTLELDDATAVDAIELAGV